MQRAPAATVDFRLTNERSRVEITGLDEAESSSAFKEEVRMRRLYSGILALMVAMLFAGGAAKGQIAGIRFVPGPQKLVAFSPRYIIADFFNGDPFEDAAVTSSVSTKITAALGQSTG